MAGRYRARCLIDGCPWRAKGDGPAVLGLDALSAHVNRHHRRTT